MEQGSKWGGSDSDAVHQTKGGQNMKRLKNEAGFTMIELVVVIVILGILAAFAVPRYTALQTQARAAAVNGLAGGLRGAVAVVRSHYIVTGATTSPVTLSDGTTVAVGTAGAAAGVPTGAAGGIDNAILDYASGFTFTAGTPALFQSIGAATPANCQASYAPGTGVVTVDVSDCS
jgi:MSHA pilin protein MshA